MSLLLNLLRAQRTAQPKYYGGGQNAQMLTLRDMLFQRAGQMPYSQGAHVLRTNTLSPNAQSETNASANTSANLSANLQANTMLNLEAPTNTPASPDTNAPANIPANVPANTPANVPANTPANVPATVAPGKSGPTQTTTPATPAIPAGPTPLTPPTPRTVTVKPGDTLSGIAQRELGRASRWSEIYALNRAKIANPNVIHPGTVLVLPLAGNNNAPVEVPGNLPAVPNNVPANTPANVPANTPANVPANTPANVPANTPANLPANTPANVPQQDDNVANQANAMVEKLTGLVTLMKGPSQQAPTQANPPTTAPATPQATTPAAGPSQLPPGLQELRQKLKPVTDPEALKAMEAARTSLAQANPQLAASAQGKELLDVYAQVIGQMLQKPDHLENAPRDGAGWVARAQYNAQWLSWKRQIEGMFRPVQETVVRATENTNQAANPQQTTRPDQQTQQTISQDPGHRPLPGTPAYEALFAQHLRIGIETLQAAKLRFGRADNQGKGHFDATYWAIQGDTQYGAMLVHTGAGKPHQAIDEMFANVGRWTMDCAEFVQAAQLYAMRHALGADAFDSKYASAKLTFRVHGSSGVNTKALYHADSAGAKPVMVTAQGRRNVDQSMEEILRAAPMGSRAMWTNPYAPATSAWLNENAVKIGDDLYAAHPMGTFPAERIIKILHNANPGTQSRPNKVFLRQVEVYYSH